jgi:hypothetical protein
MPSGEISLFFLVISLKFFPFHIQISTISEGSFFPLKEQMSGWMAKSSQRYHQYAVAF